MSNCMLYSLVTRGGWTVSQVTRSFDVELHIVLPLQTGQVDRASDLHPGGPGSTPGRVMPKTLKTYSHNECLVLSTDCSTGFWQYDKIITVCLVTRSFDVKLHIVLPLQTVVKWIEHLTYSREGRAQPQAGSCRRLREPHHLTARRGCSGVARPRKLGEPDNFVGAWQFFWRGNSWKTHSLPLTM